MTQPLSPSSAASHPSTQKEKGSKLPWVLPIVALLAAVGTATWYVLSRPDPSVLQLDGRVEGYETDVGSKTPGRVIAIAVREGDLVKAGQVIVEIDDDEIRAEVDQITARLESAKQQAEQARVRIAVLESQVDEAQLNLTQSEGDTQGRISQAEASLEAAKANLNQAEADAEQAAAELRLAKLERDRFAQLSSQGAVPVQQFDQAQTALEKAEAVLAARQAAIASATRQVSALEGGLVQVKTTAINPEIRNTRLTIAQRELDVARSQLVAAQADVRSADAARREVLARLKDLKVVSPIDGVVIARSVEPGVVVTGGKTLLTLINPKDIYLRGFIPQGDIGKIRIGQAAQVFLDSAPDQPIRATVAAIDTQASFTPENVYFRDDRVRQVFGVRLTIDDPNGFAKPGMPASGKILLR